MATSVMASDECRECIKCKLFREARNKAYVHEIQQGIEHGQAGGR